MFPTRRITTSGGDVFRDEFSLAFDGTDDYIQLPMPINYSAVTISAWIKVTEDSNAKVIVGARDSSSDGLIFFLDSSERLILRVNGQGTSTTGMDITPNVWTHVVGTYDGDLAIAYINTIASSPKDISTDGITTVTSNAKIGRNAQSSANPYNGNISEIAIYDKALSASEVKTLYNGREPYNHKEGVCSSNLQAWYRMGDGVLDNFNHIADQTNATLGNDLVTEGDFSNGGAAWTTSGSTVTTAIDGGAFVSTGDSDGGLSTCSQAETLTSGNAYLLRFDVTAVTGSPSVHNYCDSLNKTLGVASVKTYTDVFISNGTGGIDIRTICANGQSVTIDNIKLQLVNGNAGVMTNMSADNIEGDSF